MARCTTHSESIGSLSRGASEQGCLIDSSAVDVYRNTQELEEKDHTMTKSTFLKFFKIPGMLGER